MQRNLASISLPDGLTIPGARTPMIRTSNYNLSFYHQPAILRPWTMTCDVAMRLCSKIAMRLCSKTDLLLSSSAGLLRFWRHKREPIFVFDYSDPS